MVRLSLFAFLALTLSGVASAAPQLGNVHAASERDFRRCGNGSGGIISVTTAPDPPVPGGDLSVTLVASTPVTIVDGSFVNVTAYANPDGEPSVKTNICDSGTSCPIRPGVYSFTFSVLVPKEVHPYYDVYIHTEGRSPSNEELFCFETTLIPHRCDGRPGQPNCPP